MGAGLDDDGRKLLRMDQYLDLGSNGFKSWVCGGMDSCLVARSGLQCNVGNVCMYRSQGQDADRMTLPHHQATKLGQSVPVPASDQGSVPPSWSVNGNQNRPTAGATLHTGSLVLGPPRASCHFTVYVPLATAHLASHTTVPCLAVRKHLGTTVDFIPLLVRVPARYWLIS